MSREPLLRGLRVVEIGQYIAAPFAATLFADQGAEVVKIERPGGDPYRRDPAGFAAWNRGKASVELDLATADGRAEALALIDGADVLIENLRPGALDAPRARARRAARPPARSRHVLDLGLRQLRAFARRPGVGAARARASGRPAGDVHRGSADLAPVPDGEHRGRAVRGARDRGRAREARDHGIRPARGDVAVRRVAVPQRRTDLPPGPAPVRCGARGAHAGAPHVRDAATAVA